MPNKSNKAYFVLEIDEEGNETTQIIVENDQERLALHRLLELLWYGQGIRNYSNRMIKD